MSKNHYLVIGGTKGIGRQLTLSLSSQDNTTVSVISRRVPINKEKVVGVSYFELDLSKRKEIPEVCEQVIRTNGNLTNIVFTQRHRSSENQWDNEIEVMLSATRCVIDYCSKYFLTNNDNSIVIVSSLVSTFIVENQPISYHITRAALDQMIRYYAVALGKSGIRVNGVASCTVLKEENKRFLVEEKNRLKVQKNITPLARVGTAEDICSVINFLMSSNSSFVTGQVVIVDGGLSLRWHESIALDKD
jgi:NAD(P)-dependent dehydrogenase (short-subunit alcohol dehydrogenase family)